MRLENPQGIWLQLVVLGYGARMCPRIFRSSSLPIFRSSSRFPLAYPVLVLTGKGEGRVIRTHGSRTGKTGRQITSWTVRKMAPKIKPTVTSKRASPVGTTRPCGPLTPLRRNKFYSTERKYNGPPKPAGKHSKKSDHKPQHNLHVFKPQSLQVLIKTFCLQLSRSSSFNKNFYQV